MCTIADFSNRQNKKIYSDFNQLDKLKNFLIFGRNLTEIIINYKEFIQIFEKFKTILEKFIKITRKVNEILMKI